MFSGSRRTKRLGVLLGIMLSHVGAATAAADAPPKAALPEGAIVSEAATFRVEAVASGLEIPWSLAFLPDGRALVGEREIGRLSLLDVRTGARTEVEGLPEMLRDKAVSAGLFDVRPHPDFAHNGWIYLLHAVGTQEASGLALTRARLDGTRLKEAQRLFAAAPQLANKHHFGGRIVFKDGDVYFSTGDGFDFKERAQDLSTDAGKIIRLRDDGSVPKDNPFVATPGARPEIWAYGLRNPQGLTLDPATGALWEVEHGPQGGDEVNLIRPGTNYGWPVITYGEEYGGGPIGDGITRKDGMAQPVYYWRPSIAPSGARFYRADAFPGWRGNLFVGALALTHLNRLVVEDGRVLHEERLLVDKGWRVRFAEPGPDGFLYIGNDDGQIVRLVPVAG